MIRGPYLNHISLNSNEENSLNEFSLCFESKVPLKDAIKKIKQNYPLIAKKYFKNDINVDAIKHILDNNKKSVSQADYSLKGMDCKINQMKKYDFKFDDNHVIPETSQQYSYRPPQSVAMKGIERVKPIRPITDDSLQKKLNEILEVKCGDSVYMMGHSLLGTAILESKPFGEPYKSPMCERWGDPENSNYTYTIRH
ncbi:uncharacterized protein LOC143909325 [Arctopsyche grandis]|uniref:uncharacterized protein LOC143909325 n=1 Tax=Arctopsyche grandis TaxID=121162 RepID=UPI00406D7AD0